VPDRGMAYTPEQLRASVYRDRPYIFNGLRHTLSELLSIARTYSALQKYEVTLNALNAIAKLLAGYLSIRDGDLMMPSSIHAMFGPTEFEFDTVLTEALEGISELNKASIRGGDIQLSLQIIDILEYLAIQSVGIHALFARPDENPTTAFIRAYMLGPVQDGAVRGQDDVIMSGARALSSIAKALLRKNQYLTVRTSIDELEKLAYFGIAQRKAHVTGTPVKGIAEILLVAVAEPIAERHTIHSALLAEQRICEAEMQFKSPTLDQSLRFALGAFLDMTQPTALANLEGLAIQGLSEAMEKHDLVKTDAYREVIRELNDGLWQHFVAIGVAAAKTESFALFDINSNISEIARQCLWLLGLLSRTKPEPIDEASALERRLHERFEADILKELNWIVGATYWRIFDALQPPVKTHVIWDFFPTLSHIGIQALDANVPSVAESAISELKSMALRAMEKPVESLQAAARIAAFVARIGIVALKLGAQRIVDVSIATLKEFQPRYLRKQREVEPEAESYDATLLNEIEDFKSELGIERWLIDEEDASFFGRVIPEDIDRFVALL